MRKSGIGRHFHNASEENVYCLGGMAEFMIDGHTSRLRGPVGAPLRAGHSHGVYNLGGVPLQWMNTNVRVSAAASGPGAPGYSNVIDRLDTEVVLTNNENLQALPAARVICYSQRPKT